MKRQRGRGAFEAPWSIGDEGDGGKKDGRGDKSSDEGGKLREGRK
jgi:hypothetical protein